MSELMDTLSLKALNNIPEINPGMNISELIIQNIYKEGLKLKSGDIIVIAQKIISKTEDRYVKLSNIEPSTEALALAQKVDKTPEFIQLVINESNKILSSDNNILITEHKLGFVNINAGIDMSNIRDNKSKFFCYQWIQIKLRLGLARL